MDKINKYLNKKNFLILGGTISLFSIYWIFSKTHKLPSSLDDKVIATIQPRYENSFGDIITSEISTTEMPKSLPLFKISNEPLNEQYITQTANKLGFSGNPKHATDVNQGTLLFWINNNSSIFFFPETRTIQYNSGAATDDKTSEILSEVALTDIAKSFLIDNNLLTTEEIGKDQLSYLVESKKYEGFDKTNREKASMIKIVFSPKALGYDVITQGSVEPTTSIFLLPNGVISSAQITKFIFQDSQKASVTIKSTKEVLDTFDTDAVLIGTTNSEISLKNISKDSLKDTTISEIKLTYLLGSPKATLLYPIFLITGQSTATGFNDKLETVFYMYASKSNSPQ